jgi:dTDP-4-dehydrorhamnose reductase
MQYSNGQKISKFELLSIFKDVWHKNNIQIHPVPGKNIDKSLFPSIHTAISPAPSYIEMCTELREYMHRNENTYSLYQ